MTVVDDTDTRVKVRIDLPLPLDVAGGLMGLIGARWPGAVAITEGDERKLTIAIPDSDREALDDAEGELGGWAEMDASARSELFLEQLSDGTMGVSGPEWVGRFFSKLLGGLLDDADAPNYLEIRMTGAEGEIYSVNVGRPGVPSVHDLRRAAEARVAELEAELAAGCN